ncbi:MAG: type I DNA topoisomerase [Deltaproteobacteria bacterium]|jgi:DNA topoisomerase-1|nr:type I DNA topoisomerase [Deltaproteobacteria bacterium]
MPKNLLIVESPAKAKTIGKYLGPDFEVMASVGHIIDLPKSRLGVDVNNDFSPEYVPIEGKQKVILALKKAAKGKDVVYLGPDPDREGEAIAWHIAESLGQGQHNFKRVLFHELTPQAIKAAINEPAALSQSRFDSQQTRRILDRLVGYMISPILWDKLKRGLSAGRVQSVALRILVERERSIQAFLPVEYWTVTGFFESGGSPFEAALVKHKGEKIEPATQEEAEAVVQAVTGKVFVVSDLNSKDRQRRPSPPFTTSTLQQAAYHRYKMDPSRTMKTAQSLYEGVELPGGTVGLITYMRTDSVRINEQAAKETQAHIKKTLGSAYVPDKPNYYKNKKGAQDAHEAIRPTSVERTPDSLRGQLDGNQWQLYDLVWRRFVASQMSPATIKQTTAELSANDYCFRTSGSVVTFKGFLAVYSPETDEDKNMLPPLHLNQELWPEKIEPKQHFTQPPPRFNEATLVKELEEQGIGRPSTYASIISVLRDKEYVEGKKGQLRPSEMGTTVNDLLVACFPRMMDVAFTAAMEEDLDQIEEGAAAHLDVLNKFYAPLIDSLATAKTNMPNVKIDGLPVDAECPSCRERGHMSIRYGRNGFYLSCSNCNQTTDFTRDEKGAPLPAAPLSLNEELFCEKCGQPMTIKKGKYGAFLACTGYPACRNAKPLVVKENGETQLVEEKLPPLPEGMDPDCPKCGKPLVVKKAKRGNFFIACSGYPKCKEARSFPTGFHCPRPGCSGVIEEKQSRRGPFFGCSDYPACRLILKGSPVKESCPKCNFPYLVESNISARRGEMICPNPDCPTNQNEGQSSSPAWVEAKGYAKTPSKTAAGKTKVVKNSSSKLTADKPTAAKRTAAKKTAEMKTTAVKKTTATRKVKPLETDAGAISKPAKKTRAKTVDGAKSVADEKPKTTKTRKTSAASIKD